MGYNQRVKMSIVPGPEQARCAAASGPKTASKSAILALIVKINDEIHSSG
jgi:hypothetical protein